MTRNNVLVEHRIVRSFVGFRQTAIVSCRIAVLLVVAISCSNETSGDPDGNLPDTPAGPTNPPVDHPPVLNVVGLGFVVNSDQLILRVTASDPDGTPVGIQCTGDVDAVGTDSILALVPAQRMERPQPLRTRCISTSNGKNSEPIMAFVTIPPAATQIYVDELARVINAYRAQQGLSSIPVSRSLGYVALNHVLDLNDHRPDASPGCNGHSWSGAGPWSACCYTPDHAQAACMWDKPRELTQYPGTGYEIAVTSTGTNMSPERALEGWKGSPLHHEVILNRGPWNEKWNAIGGGLYRGYGAVWFGREPDPAPR